MNKHIIGVIIFSFIVGTSAIVASFFVKIPPLPTVEPVAGFNDFVYRSEKNCKGKKRKHRPKSYDQSASVKVTQAVFDAKLKRLDTQLMIERSDESTESVDVVLQFFVSDDFGVQHIAEEYVTLNPNFDMGDVAVTKNNSSFKWLNNLQSMSNLYVIARATNGKRDVYNPVEFDSSTATAVLLKPAIAKK